MNFAEIGGLPAKAINLVGETTLNALIGFIRPQGRVLIGANSLEANGFRDMRNISAIETWRASLSVTHKAAQNNPQVIIRNWRRSMGPEAARQVVRSDQQPGYGKAVHWPSDALRRAAGAASFSHDAVGTVLAKLPDGWAARLSSADTLTAEQVEALKLRAGDAVELGF